MRKQVVHVEVPCTASAETVFEILQNTAGWPTWAKASEARLDKQGSPEPEGVGAIRVFKVGRVTSTEEVLAYERPTHFAYRLISGLPLRDYKATVDITPNADTTGCTITWESTFFPKIPGTGWANQFVMSRFISDTAKRLAKAAESAPA